MDMFWYIGVWREILPLRGAFSRSSSHRSRSRSVQQDSRIARTILNSKTDYFSSLDKLIGVLKNGTE